MQRSGTREGKQKGENREVGDVTIVEKNSNAIHSVVHSDHRALGYGFDGKTCHNAMSAKERCIYISFIDKRITGVHGLQLGLGFSERFALELGIGGIRSKWIYKLFWLQSIESTYSS